MGKGAYYNEFDPKAAAWLRELIKRGLIAAGDVDERDIRHVRGGKLKVTRNAISSPVSADGLMRCDSPDGPTIGESGQALALASRSHSSDNTAANPTIATCGRNSAGSSRNATKSIALQESLASKLVARMGANGTPEFALIWKRWDMPSPPPICALEASARHTYASAFIGVPTLFAIEEPLFGWATPTHRDWKDTAGMATTATNPDGSERLRLDMLPRQAIGCSGRNLTSSIAATAGQGELNPAHSRWLMGYPPAWDESAVTAMQSCHSSRPNLSAHGKRQEKKSG